MDKQSTLAFILIGIILVFWLYLNSPQPPVDQPHKEDTTKVVVNSDTLNLRTKLKLKSLKKKVPKFKLLLTNQKKKKKQ